MHRVLPRVSPVVLLAVLNRGNGWKMLRRVSAGVLLLVVYDWYVVGKCCGRMVWHMVLVVVCEWDIVVRCCTGCSWWCDGADFGVIVDITFAAETRQRDLCEQLRFGESERLLQLVGGLHVVDVYICFSVPLSCYLGFVLVYIF